jgi:hypothetical protein
MTFLVLVYALNLHGHHGLCLQSSFTMLSWNSVVSVHLQVWKVGAVPLAEPRIAATRQQDAPPQGRFRAPFPGWNVKSKTSPKIVEINKPPVPKTETQETEKILTRQFLLIKRVQACTHCSWADTWAQNGQQQLLLISIKQLYLPLTWDLSRLKVHNLPQLAKSLGGWFSAFHRQWSCTRIQKNK